MRNSGMAGPVGAVTKMSSAVVQVFYYTGLHTRTPFSDSAAMIARMAPAQSARFAALPAAAHTAVRLAAWRLLELGMLRLGQEHFRLADITHRELAKPQWFGQGAGLQVDFSLSHARGVAACAIATGITVGCDVEERARIQTHLTQRIVRQDAARLPCWTEVEAVVKAAGIGIAHGHDVLWTATAAQVSQRQWWCYRFDCGPQFAAHVAADAPYLRVVATEVTEL
jgi:phosphopantetheinyl transferase